MHKEQRYGGPLAIRITGEVKSPIGFYKHELQHHVDTLSWQWINELPSQGATIQELRKVDWLHASKWTMDVNKWQPVCVGPAGDKVSEFVRTAYVEVNSVLIKITGWTRMSIWTRILGTAPYMLKGTYKERDISTMQRMADAFLF